MTTQAIATARIIPTNAVRLDWLGVLCSFGCAVHCAAMPVLRVALPSLTSVQWLADPLFHQVVALFCGFLVARAILPGYRFHRSRQVVALASIGVGLLFSAAFVLPSTCCSGSLTFDTVQQSESSNQILLVSASQNQQNIAMSKLYLKLPKSENATCAHSKSTLGQSLLSVPQLTEIVGRDGAVKLIGWQPYLTPCGGLFLIVAHILNIRLRCCKRGGCKSNG